MFLFFIFFFILRGRLRDTDWFCAFLGLGFLFLFGEGEGEGGVFISTHFGRSRWSSIGLGLRSM